MRLRSGGTCKMNSSTSCSYPWNLRYVAVMITYKNDDENRPVDTNLINKLDKLLIPSVLPGIKAPLWFHFRRSRISEGNRDSMMQQVRHEQSTWRKNAARPAPSWVTIAWSPKLVPSTHCTVLRRLISRIRNSWVQCIWILYVSPWKWSKHPNSGGSYHATHGCQSMMRFSSYLQDHCHWSG